MGRVLPYHSCGAMDPTLRAGLSRAPGKDHLIDAMIALAFLWHQHQPYYPDDVAGDNPMPWVRLHGIKDYYGMALHLLEVPEMRCTINLVPSLVLQILQYTEQGKSDHFL